jgi:hypothetical protein
MTLRQFVTVKPCIKCGASERNYRGNCKPCKRTRAKIWREENPGAHKAKNRKWYEQNKTVVKARALKWKKENPERSREILAKWKESNPEAYRDMQTRNFHMRRSAHGKLSKGIIQTLLDAQGGLCACCGVALNGVFHLDHIMPLALGGSNTDDNVQLLTPACNYRKGYKHPDDYARLQRDIYDWDDGDIRF